MTSENYRDERKRRGTLKEVGEKLGVHWTTLSRRENGQLPLNREAELALLSLPARRPKRRRQCRT